MLKFKNINGARTRTIEFIWQLDAQGRLTATPRVIRYVSTEATPGLPRLALTKIGSILIERQRRTRMGASTAGEDQPPTLVGVPRR